MVLCTVLAAAGAAYYIVSNHPTYRATAQVVANPQVANNAGANTVTFGSDPLAATRDPSVAQAAAKASGLPLASVALGSYVDGTNTALVDIVDTAPTATAASAGANAAAGAYVSVRSREFIAQAAALNTQLDTLLTSIRQLQAQGATAPGSPTPGTDVELNTKLSAQLTSYATYYAEQQQFEQAATSVQVYSNASPASAQRVGSTKRNAAVGVLAGLLIGIGIALLRDRFDDRIRDRRDLADVTDINVLARVPTTSEASWSNTLTGLEGTGDEAAEAIRELRTALRFMSVDRPLKTILVTSSAAGEGKSFIAANLAAAWAVSGLKTILVSSDLRAPSIETKLGIEATSRGLTGALADASSLEGSLRRPALPHREPRPGEPRASKPSGRSANGNGANGNGIWPSERAFDLSTCLVPTGLEGLAILPAGPIPPNPAELLGSRAFEALLARLESVADVVILDTPPVLAVTDAMVLTGLVQGVLFVIAEGESTKSATKRALDLLQAGAAPVLGTVVNRAGHVDVMPYYGYVSAPPSGRRGSAKGRAPKAGKAPTPTDVSSGTGPV